MPEKVTMPVPPAMLFGAKLAQCTPKFAEARANEIKNGNLFTFGPSSAISEFGQCLINGPKQ